MALKHRLDLEIPDSNKITLLRVLDASTYADGIAVKCPRLRILTPGAAEAVEIDVQIHFNIGLDSLQLGLNPVGNSDQHDLPDGIYAIRYSVSPNDKVWIEYNLLRTVESMNLYHETLGQIGLQTCEPPHEVKKKVQELFLIEAYIKAAKVEVEYKHNPEKGIALLTYADKLLTRFRKCHLTC
jgi:hypothetical protein